MANGRDKRGTTSGAAADFNATSQEGAPASPRINRQNVISQIKGILKKNRADRSFVTYDNEVLEPTDNQSLLMDTIGKTPVVFVEGPFGTGKTIWTAYMALLGLVEKKYNRIAITAPVVEAGEKLGFLKGDKDEKMLPYVNQILESIDDWVGKDLRIKLQETGILEIEPHAFLRGRSMKKTYFILDECQNATGPQLMTSISRLGYDSTFVYMGDNRQNDRTNGDSAYVQFVNRFTDHEYMEQGFVGHVRLCKDDVRRHPFLKMIVDRGDERPLEQFETHSSGNGVSVAPRAPSGPSFGRREADSPSPVRN